MSYLHGQALVNEAMKHVGRYEYSSMCQAFCVTMARTGAVGDFDGDRAADAQDGWKKAKAHGQVVLASQIESLNDIPAGTFLYWEGGSHGYGHVAISIGNGKCISTDAPSWGRIGIVPIDWIAPHWRNGLVFRGYVVIEGNGHRMVDKIPTPTPLVVTAGHLNPANYGPGNVNQYVTDYGKALVKKGFGRHYVEGPGPRWDVSDELNTRDFQLSKKELRGDADGLPGPLTLKFVYS
jgi:hypothetical protein